MPTFIYKTRDGKRVPSVTTINKIGQPSEGLVAWAWNLGIEGKDYRQVRDAAADSGSVGHALVDAAIRGVEPDLSQYPDSARSGGETAFRAYKEFREQTKIEIIASEVPLVHEELRYGGCLDAVGRRENGKMSILDWKSGGLYPDHLCQMAAYGALWEANHPRDLIQEYHLCRFNKENGDFTHAYFSDLSDAWMAFIKKRELYDLIADLKKRV